MHKTIAIRLTGVSLAICCLGGIPFDACAQYRPAALSSHSPWACVFLEPDADADTGSKDDPAEEQSYDASMKELYRLWCTASLSKPQDRQDAANRAAVSWKALWYRDDPFNAAFHETGSFGLLVLMGVTHKVPKPMVDDLVFMHDWLADCSDRCFMLYGDDDLGAHEDWLRFMRLRKEVIVHLGGDPAARRVVTMLKNAKLYPVK